MKKVMLVDDTDISNLIMKKFIEVRVPGTNIKEFTDPEEAFRSIETVNPDIIFLDLNMPVMNGWEFLEKMRNQGYHQKVAILTSSTSHQDIDRSHEYGNVINFYVKPLTPDELARVFEDIQNFDPA